MSINRYLLRTYVRTFVCIYVFLFAYMGFRCSILYESYTEQCIRIQLPGKRIHFFDKKKGEGYSGGFRGVGVLCVLQHPQLSPWYLFFFSMYGRHLLACSVRPVLKSAP